MGLQFWKVSKVQSHTDQILNQHTEPTLREQKPFAERSCAYIGLKHWQKLHLPYTWGSANNAKNNANNAVHRQQQERWQRPVLSLWKPSHCGVVLVARELSSDTKQARSSEPKAPCDTPFHSNVLLQTSTIIIITSWSTSSHQNAGKIARAQNPRWHSVPYIPMFCSQVSSNSA